MKNDGFFAAVYRLVASIPPGKVMTYGQIARELHSPYSAKLVGFAMSSAPEHLRLPCHRVINRLGEMAHGDMFGGQQAQRQELQAEGVPFLPNGRINLALPFSTLVKRPRSEQRSEKRHWGKPLIRRPLPPDPVSMPCTRFSFSARLNKSLRQPKSRVERWRMARDFCFPCGAAAPEALFHKRQGEQTQPGRGGQPCRYPV